METVKEKLTELIMYNRCGKTSKEIADILIQNGVTIATDTNVGDKWVSVDERLPKKMTNKVLVRCKNGYIGFGHYEKYKGYEEWYNLESGSPFRKWNLDEDDTYEVTHWMPLPEPPKVWKPKREDKNCYNCKHGDTPANKVPCSECHSNDDKWEGVQ